MSEQKLKGLLLHWQDGEGSERLSHRISWNDAIRAAMEATAPKGKPGQLCTRGRLISCVGGTTDEQVGG